ncbi:MAG: hypothetical protein ACLGHQ_15760 [Acidimicrobiia bacterium]
MTTTSHGTARVLARVNVVATARPTFAVAPALVQLDLARSLLRDLGAELVGPSEVVMTADDVDAALPEVDLDADVLLHVCATFSDASPARGRYRDADRPIVRWAFREPGAVGARLWWNSLCGANLMGHALVRDGHDVRLVYGDPGEPAVRDALRRALAGELPPRASLPRSTGERAPADVARAALDRVRGRRIGALGDGPTGFTPSEYDADQLRALLGLEISPKPLDELFASIRDVPVHVRERERESATEWQPSIAVLDGAEVDRFVATTVALREWHESEHLDALAIRCWPEFPTELGMCPCSALSRLADEHVPTQCERDVHGAATMLLLDALGTGPTYLVDTVDVVPEDNVVRFWHCGAAATQLAADPDDATQWVHANRKIGVTGNFALRPGRVVATRLTEDPSRPGTLRMLIAAGTALDAPNRFQGNTADVRLDADAGAFVAALVTGGFPHHTVLAWTDVRPELRAVADELGIEVIEFE